MRDKIVFIFHLLMLLLPHRIFVYHFNVLKMYFYFLLLHQEFQQQNVQRILLNNVKKRKFLHL